jgi:Putative transposase, YhgA-like
MGRTKRTRRRHDQGYRLLFSHPEMVEDLLRHLVREPWVQRLAFGTLRRLPATHVSEDLRSRSPDIAWRVSFAHVGVPIYLLFEFQSTVDPYMAVRMEVSAGLLLQDLIRRSELLPGGLLPPVVPVLIYNARSPWSAARELGLLVPRLPGGLDRYRPRLHYRVVGLGRVPKSRLPGPESLMGALVRLERAQSLEAVREVVASLRQRLRSPAHRSLRRAFASWLTRVLLPARLPGVEVPEAEDFEEVEAMLEDIDWTRTAKEQGRAEGLQKGWQEGEARVLLTQLEHKFGRVPKEVRSRVATANPDQLLRWAPRVLTAVRLEEVFDG